MKSKDLEQIIEKYAVDAEERTQRYLGALKEDFDHKLDVVLEAVKEVLEMKRTVDSTFEKVGEISVDVEAIKEAVKDHARRLERVEAR